MHILPRPGQNNFKRSGTTKRLEAMDPWFDCLKILLSGTGGQFSGIGMTQGNALPPSCTNIVP
jgi:hypothetical protein